MNKLAIERGMRFILFAIALGVSLEGCAQPRATTWYIMPPELSCNVVIYSPPIPKDRPPDHVIIVWENHVIFDGDLPRDDGTYIPLRIAHIHAAQGTYLLKVSHENQTQELRIRLKNGDDRTLMIFGNENGKEVLIKDYGDEHPVFL